MANRAVKLYRKVKTTQGWKRYPAVMAANGKVKPDIALVGDSEQKFPIGHYELRSFQGSKTVWTRVNGGPSEALAALRTAQRKAALRIEAEQTGIRVIEEEKRISLQSALKQFKEAAEARGSLEASEVYGRTIGDFITVTGKQYADQITSADVTQFQAAMRKRKLSDRTVSNRHGHLRSFLRFLKLDADAVKEIAGSKPRFEKTLPEVFEPDELSTFFGSLDEEYDQLLFDVLLTCGLREQEVMHLEWTDLNKVRGTLKVQSKPRWGFKVKDAEERELPVNADLMTRLFSYRENDLEARLVFGSKGGKVDVPDGHLLRRLKVLARDAGLNCGSCKGCVARRECEHWFLHKFRATFITTLLRNGLDLRTVMSLSGHTDLESVMRYLRPAEGKHVQDRINAIKWR
ncbi:integrase [Silvibacterium bohemicum]|uniref:Integrase n=1 Tax=Silvibacterium bohemicum TaxID=1577686 RepID=A0A841K0K8_9BACT|nr:tyrosine-type recombinase/integrase [Silvibacterium bohemicum]MBB6144741.1 integrase [Silvibacterium bohemicum]